MKRLLSTLAALLVIALGLWLTGWWPNVDRSIELTESFGRVENGSAYDRAALDIGPAKKIVLPHDALVRRVSEPGKVQFFMKKTLNFFGHPPEPMTIRDARSNMGCAIKLDGYELLVATFGVWDSHIEGGTHMKIVAYVPEGIRVDQRQGLSGPDSAGQEWRGQYLSQPKDAKVGFWYGPTSPTEEWTAVPDVPDPDRTAR